MKRLAGLALFTFFYCTFLFSQDTGQITGTVRDNSGAVVPDAQVTIQNPAQGITRQVTTNHDGEYLAAGLPAGEYEIAVSAKGFQQFKISNVTLRVAQKTRADAKL